MRNLCNKRPQDQRGITLSNGGSGAIIRIDGDGNCLFKAVVEGYQHLGQPIPEYLSDHKALRKQVIQELTKSKYTPIINATLSDEKNVSVDAITDEDRDTYRIKMAKSNVWGGTPELYAIANLIQSRIILYKPDGVLKIPQEANYDTWPEWIELVYEPVDAGLMNASSGDEMVDNHYNLALPEDTAKHILNDFNCQQILIVKEGIQKCPYPDAKEFEDFKNFFFSFYKFHKTIQAESPDTRLKDKYFYHLEMLWSHLLGEFMSPMWSYDDGGYNGEVGQRYWFSGRVDTVRLKELINEARERNELKSFFEAYPYVEDLIAIDEYLHTESPTIELTRRFFQVTSNYLRVLQHYDKMQPILVLKELIKIMLSRSDVDVAFYKKYMKSAERHLRERMQNPKLDLVFLSLFIGTHISYDLRMLAGFNKFNWNAFDGLYRSLFNGNSTITNDRLDEVAEGLERYLDDLLLFQMGQISGDAIRTIDVSDIAAINTKENLEPAFQIIEDYLSILDQIAEENETARLALLRAITALGEAVHSISLLLPEPYREHLAVLTKIRDHIIHASTWDAFQYINELVNSDNNRQLFTCLDELRGLSGFFQALKNCFDSGSEVAELPDIPAVETLIQLEEAFAEVRKRKDDRDEQLPVAQRERLLSSLSPTDQIDNPLLNEVEDFIYHGINISISRFKEACPRLTAKRAKNLHEKIIERKKITALREALDDDDRQVDFNRINLNVAKDKKDRLTAIKQDENEAALKVFLDEHEQKVSLTEAFLSDFVESIRLIDITDYKKLLNKLAKEGIGETKKEEFDKAVSVVFRDYPDYQKLWELSYELLNTKHINSLKRYQMIQLDHTMQSIERLKLELKAIFNGTHTNVCSNPVISIACEMLYGFCLEGFKRIQKFLKPMHDYQDQTLYFFNPDHPIENVDALLTVAIKIRNDMFHFERVYRDRMPVGFLRELWFSSIQDLTYGTYFPEAIVCSSVGVSREPMMSNPAYQKLQRLRDAVEKDLSRDENALNVYEAEVKSILCKARITADAKRVMNIIIPLSQFIRQWIVQIPLSVNNLDRLDNIFLNIFRFLDIQYIEPSTFLQLLNTAVTGRIIRAETVQASVHSSQNVFFAQDVMDAQEQEPQEESTHAALQ